MEVVDQVCAKLGLDKLNDNKAIQQYTKDLPVKPAHIGLGLSVLVGFLVLFEFGVTWVSFAVGFLYPAYMSFKAIETQDNQEDDQFWLTYWVVFGFLNVFQGIIDFIFSFIPLFHIVKIAFYVYLFHPKTKGALMIYNNFVKGFLKKYESKIDSKIDEVQNLAEKKADQLKDTVTDLKREAVNQAIN